MPISLTAKKIIMNAANNGHRRVETLIISGIRNRSGECARNIGFFTSD